MTRTELASELNLQFGNSTYYDQQAVFDSVQDGADEICAFTGCIFKTAALPFTQFTTYYDMLSLIPDFVGVFAIFNGVTRRWLWPTSLRKLNEISPKWDTLYGTP